eukprot:TRINITY_DN4556_c0_g1_i1.p1 TRINITY_DN4556_c0_g1~~TRINITY_DN4556_c0_g1_i1.p1  ORF type:complete len:1040 (+),score=375.83 TRINITY_DN4556_c0_g1_i1:43-3120(+)
MEQGGSIVLEEDYDESYEPTPEEIEEYAKWLGMDLKVDQDLLWIAREALKAPLPPGWKPCKTGENGDLYYFHFQTGESTWDHPSDDHYKKLYATEKQKQIDEASLPPTVKKTPTKRVASPTSASGAPLLAPILKPARVLQPLKTEQRVRAMVKEEVEKSLQAESQDTTTVQQTADLLRQLTEAHKQIADAQAAQKEIEARLNTVSEECESLRDTCEQAKKTRRELLTKLETTEQQVQTLQNELKEAKAAAEAAQRDASSLKDAAATTADSGSAQLQQEIDSLKAQVASQSDTIDELRDDLDVAEQTATAAGERLQNAEAALASEKATVNTLAAELEQAGAKQAQIDLLNGKLEAAEQVISTLEQRLKDQEADFATRNTDTDVSAKVMGDLQHKLTTLQQQLTEIQQTNATMLQSNAKLEQDLTTARETSQQLETQLRAQLTSSQAEVQQQQAALTQANEQLQSLREQLQKGDNVQQRKLNTSDDLELPSFDSDEEGSAKPAKPAADNQQLEALSAKLQASEQAQERLQEQLTALQRELAAAEQANEKAQQQISALQRERDDVQLRLKNTISESLTVLQAEREQAEHQAKQWRMQVDAATRASEAAGETQTTALRGQLSEALRVRAAVEFELQQIKTSSEQLTLQVNSLEAELSIAQRERDIAKQQAQSVSSDAQLAAQRAEQQLFDLRSQLTSAEQQQQQTTGSKSDSALIAELRNQLDDMTRSKGDLEAELQRLKLRLQARSEQAESVATTATSAAPSAGAARPTPPPEVLTSLETQRQAVRQAEQQLVAQKAELRKRQRELDALCSEWKQDKDSVAVAEDRRLLRDVKKQLDAEVESLNGDLKQRRVSKRMLQLQKDHLNLLEKSVDLDMSSADSEDTPSSASSATLQQVLQQVHKIEHELAQLTQKVSKASSDQKENAVPQHRDYASGATPRLQQKWRRHMTNQGSAAAASTDGKRSTVDHTLQSWHRQRTAAEELLSRHAAWLRSFRQQVTNAGQSAQANEPVLVQMGNDYALLFRKQAWA